MEKEKNIFSNKYLWITLIAIIIITISCFIWNRFKTDNKIEMTIGLLETQVELEEQIKIDGYTFEKPNVILDPYHNSPLSALIIFKTDNEEEVEITIPGKDKLTTFTHKFSKTKEHYIPVYGLYPDKVNKITVKMGDKEKVVEIKTGKLPKNFKLPIKVKANKNKLTNDLYFFTPSSFGYTCAYDVNGDVRWYLSNIALWRINRLNNGHILLSTNRLVNPPYYVTGMYEMDLLGKIYNEYSLPGGYHHDFHELENGNFLVASNDFNSGEGTVEDVIVEVNRKTGEIEKTFDLKNILKRDDGKSEGWSSYDWFHNNSVWYDKKTNSITLSGRHKDAVINIDYNTKKLNWIIGDSTNWDEAYKKYFFKPVGKKFEWQWSQHAAMITPEGYVFILDNGNNKSKDKKKYVPADKSYTRGVMYKIDTDKMTIEQVWQYGKERGYEFYSPYISDVDYIAKNHYIVHSGGISYVDGKPQNVPAGLSNAKDLHSISVELLNDEVIFEIELPVNNYRMEKMSLYGKDEFTLSKPKNLGTLGNTEYNKKEYKINLKINKIDDDYKKHNIKFTQEYDRLVFTGKFIKGSSVKLILNKGLENYTYNTIISKRPYTALCVDMFNEEETKNGIVINKYINKEGLKGKYNIYLEIEGKLYNTNNHVIF